MEETLASPKMTEIDLLDNLEKISSVIPNRVLKIDGYIFTHFFLLEEILHALINFAVSKPSSSFG